MTNNNTILNTNDNLTCIQYFTNITETINNKINL